jgi:hypothetical protein
VSSAERFVRHHRLQTDRAISQAYARLAADALAVATFHELLLCVRSRARRLLAAPVVDGHHPGVEALVHLSRFARAHVRRIRDWPGSLASWRVAVADLAGHLVCRHAAPRFLAAAWYAPEMATDTVTAMDGEEADRKRQWFIAHGHGASFRSLDLPIAMTRKMEHVFLMSPDHLGIEEAMRRAELFGLGANDDVVRAVLATRMATDLRNGEFWRTVWTFLIANARSIETEQIGPLIDFIRAIRHDRVTVETRDGFALRDPPQPSFSMKGRTVSSLMRLMQDWHRRLGLAHGGLTWDPSPLRPMLLEEPSVDPSAAPAVWEMIELTNGAQLRTEGTALHHCVGSYAIRCVHGLSRIWSLRVQRGDKIRHVLTIQVNLQKRAVVQARGFRNRLAAGKALRLLQDWSVREKLRLT